MARVLLGVEQKQMEKVHDTPLNYVNLPECMVGCAALKALKDVKCRFTPILACRVPERGDYVLYSLGLPLFQISSTINFFTFHIVF